MEKEYIIIITSNSGDLSKQIRISRKKWKIIRILGLIVVLSVITGIGFYGRVYYQAARVKALESENRKLKEENKKIKELEEKLARAEELRAKIYSMLGVDKSPEIKSFVYEGAGREIEPLKEENLQFESFSRAMKPVIKEIIKEERLIPQGFPVRGVITRGFSLTHPAVDIVAAVGTPIHVTADGVVKEVKDDPYFGKVVVIAHGKTYETLYAHLNDIIVKSGQSVRKGDIIGHLGNTGKSTGPHLHYEIHSSGKPVDPMTYLFNYASQTSKKR